jgi:hypothetical protein
MFVDQTVQVALKSGPSFIARLRDVSASGAFLLTPMRAPYMAEIRLVLRVRRNSRISESVLEGLAVRSSADGIGVEWLEFSPPGVLHLTQGLAIALRQQRSLPSENDLRQNESTAGYRLTYSHR